MKVFRSKVTAQIVADSICANGIRLTTFQVRVPKFLLQEIARHRALSLCFNSSRAIPMKVIRSQAWNDGYEPEIWGSNKPGMTAGDELTGWRLSAAKVAWRFATKTACFWHWVLEKIGLHKQHTNRKLEGDIWADGVMSATDWDNLFNLRIHPDAQPEFNELATQIRDLLERNKPTFLDSDRWHLPYIDGVESLIYCTQDAKQLSASRCARVSYGLREFDYERDMNRCDMLLGSEPIHASPFEHVATPLADAESRSGNYRGWKQYRKEIED